MKSRIFTAFLLLVFLGVPFAGHAQATGCVADFTASVSEDNPRRVTFTSLSSPSPAATIVNYTWDFGDGDIAEGDTSFAEVTHTYDGSQTEFATTLTVTDSEGCIDESDPAGVGLVSLRADFSCAVDEMTASCDASDSYSASGAIDSYAWRMGDGTELSGETVTHTYTEPGTYTVELVVLRLDTDQTHSATQSVTVDTDTVDDTPPPPAEGGLVPCGIDKNDDGMLSEDEECGYNDLIFGIQNIITWLIGIATSLGAILFAYAGFLYLTAGSDQNKVSRAKSIFRYVIKGFIIILLAWLIVYTILSVLVDPNSIDIPLEGFSN